MCVFSGTECKEKLKWQRCNEHISILWNSLELKHNQSTGQKDSIFLPFFYWLFILLSPSSCLSPTTRSSKTSSFYSWKVITVSARTQSSLWKSFIIWIKSSSTSSAMAFTTSATRSADWFVSLAFWAPFWTSISCFCVYVDLMILKPRPTLSIALDTRDSAGFHTSLRFPRKVFCIIHFWLERPSALSPGLSPCFTTWSWTSRCFISMSTIIS